jgi:competence protein ComEC
VIDPVTGRYGEWVLVETELGVFLSDVPTDKALLRGQTIAFEGHVSGDPGRRGSHAYRGVLKLDNVSVDVGSESVLSRLGSAMRRRVMLRLEPLVAGRALTAGFLVGDTSGISDEEIENMRRSGLSHFVAVSGSNVALYLGLLALVLGPLSVGPRRRAIVGLLGLPVYAAATQFEPSVMRATAMAALALGGRLVGVVMESWQLLSLAVILLVVASPGLTASAGFQLSVAATAGVIVGSRWPASGMVRRALVVTVAAQLAVAPLILHHFGSIPLAAPLANLIAAPLVAVSTMVGAVGVAFFAPLISVAILPAELVLWIARGVAVWPQIGTRGFLVLVVGSFAAGSFQRLRPMMAVAGACALIVLTLMPNRSPPVPGVVVFDVGQGDSILLHGGEGRFGLVDGGPDPTLLMERLRSYGVTHLDFVVLSHVHADHITGISGLIGRLPIGVVLTSVEPHTTPLYEDVVASIRSFDIPIETPEPGEAFVLGRLTVRVEAPLRRYASPNDQSVVLSVEGPARTMLLTGDIETHAQADLSGLRADVLKVPHQGGATSTPDWLAGIGADLAIISVGPNSFGHPATWVIEVLEESGAEVVRTDQRGDVVVPLG